MRAIASMKEQKLFTVDDFENRMKCTVNLEEYVEYALIHSKHHQKKAQKKALVLSALLAVCSVLVGYQSQTQGWEYKDLWLVFAILVFTYAMFDLFYQFIMFSHLLKKSITKEFKKDSRLSRTMDFCFTDEKMVSFYEGKHQGTFFYDEVTQKEITPSMVILFLKNGKNILLPKRDLEQANQYIRTTVENLK